VKLFFWAESSQKLSLPFGLEVKRRARREPAGSPESNRPQNKLHESEAFFLGGAKPKVWLAFGLVTGAMTGAFTKSSG
jgi:hypothetical protein